MSTAGRATASWAAVLSVEARPELRAQHVERRDILGLSSNVARFEKETIFYAHRAVAALDAPLQRLVA